MGHSRKCTFCPRQLLIAFIVTVQKSDCRCFSIWCPCPDSNLNMKHFMSTVATRPSRRWSPKLGVSYGPKWRRARVRSLWTPTTPFRRSTASGRASGCALPRAATNWPSGTCWVTRHYSSIRSFVASSCTDSQEPRQKMITVQCASAINDGDSIIIQWNFLV